MNKYILWEIVKWVSWGILVLISVVFAGYFFAAGLAWVANDSLNIIPDTPKYFDPKL